MLPDQEIEINDEKLSIPTNIGSSTVIVLVCFMSMIVFLAWLFYMKNT